VELEESLADFEAQGLGIAAFSHDTPDILSHFAERRGPFHYPLLSDPDSDAIRAFGILNRNIPEDHPFHGMARPGTFVVDANGVITAKYFEPGHRQRFTASSVLVKNFDGGGGTRMLVDADHMRLEAYPAQDVARRGNRVTLVMELDLPEKMHVYAPGVEGYTPVSVSIVDSPFLKAHETTFPDSEEMYLEAIDETVPVFHDRVRIFQDVTISPRFPGFDEPEDAELVIPATFSYQACDDTVCFIPSEVPISFTMKLVQHDGERVPDELRRKPKSSGN